MAQSDLNDCVLTDKQIGLIRKLVLRELGTVEHQIAKRAHLPETLGSQWLQDRRNQQENLQEILDALSIEPTRTTAAG